MKNLIHLKDMNKADLIQIFNLADQLQTSEYQKELLQKTIVLYFPSTSLRTRVTFEKGIYLLGGQPILFPSDTLDKKEKLVDVIGYLNQWADAIVVRHNDVNLIEEMTRYTKVPIINAMTQSEHPCEIIADLYALSKIRQDYLNEEYLYIGPNNNIGRTWKEASDLLGLSFTQCCPIGYEIENAQVEHDKAKAIIDKDIILTDSLSEEQLKDFQDYQVTLELLGKANKNTCYNPCPPFYRGEEVATDVIDSKYFVGYEFKKTLLEVQQAIMLYCMLP
jgi:Ornithine carbamoyltransferase